MSSEPITYTEIIRIAIRSAERRLREAHQDEFRRLFREERDRELRYFGR